MNRMVETREALAAEQSRAVLVSSCGTVIEPYYGSMYVLGEDIGFGSDEFGDEHYPFRVLIEAAERPEHVARSPRVR